MVTLSPARIDSLAQPSRDRDANELSSISQSSTSPLSVTTLTINAEWGLIQPVDLDGAVVNRDDIPTVLCQQGSEGMVCHGRLDPPQEYSRERQGNEAASQSSLLGTWSCWHLRAPLLLPADGLSGGATAAYAPILQIVRVPQVQESLYLGQAGYATAWFVGWTSQPRYPASRTCLSRARRIHHEHPVESSGLLQPTAVS